MAAVSWNADASHRLRRWMRGSLNEQDSRRQTPSSVSLPLRVRGTPAEYSAGLKFAIERGWLELHDSGTFVRFTQSGADLFA